MSTQLFEALETRNYLAATLIGGTLKLVGTNRADDVSFRQTPALIVMSNNGASRSFAADRVRRIIVNGSGGNDRIDLSRVGVSVVVNGDSGRDQITGGRGNDKLSGGDNGDVIHGKAGNDTISGGDGDDLLFGDDGNDSIKGDKDLDSLRGGDGDDFLDVRDNYPFDFAVGGPGRDEAEVDDEIPIFSTKLADNVSGVENEHT
jgi:Ca2+-binding RTX toxin-like protein